RPRDPLHDRRGAARRADPDGPGPDPQDLQRRLAVWILRGDLAGPPRLRPAARDLPALQLHLAAAARPVRIGVDRRRLALPDLHPDRVAALGAGPGGIRDLP